MPEAIDALVRDLSNIFAGRLKSTDEQVEFKDVIELLTGLKGQTILSGINGRLRMPGKNFIFTGKSPEEAIGLLTEEFEPSPRTRTYSMGRHQAYLGQPMIGRREKHYVYLEYGNIGAAIGGKRLLNPAYKRVSIEFLL